MLFSRSVQLRTTHCRVCVTWFEKTPQRGSSPDTCRGRQRKTGCRDRDVEDLGLRGGTWLRPVRQRREQAGGTLPNLLAQNREAGPERVPSLSGTHRDLVCGFHSGSFHSGARPPLVPIPQSLQVPCQDPGAVPRRPCFPSLSLFWLTLSSCACLPHPPTAFPAAADSAQGADPKGDDQQCMKNLFN